MMSETDASVLVEARKYANDLLTVAVYMVAADDSERLVSWHASIEEADNLSEALRVKFPTHWFLVKEGN